LQFPITSVLVASLPNGLLSGISGYIIFVANSSLWGLVLWYILRRIFQKASSFNH